MSPPDTRGQLHRVPAAPAYASRPGRGLALLPRPLQRSKAAWPSSTGGPVTSSPPPARSGGERLYGKPAPLPLAPGEGHVPAAAARTTRWARCADPPPAPGCLPLRQPGLLPPAPHQPESHRRPAGTRTGDRRQPSAELLPPPGPLGARCRRALGPRTRALPRALRLPPHRTRPPCCGRGSSARPGLARPPQATRRARQAPGLTGRCLFKRSDVSAAQPWQRPVTLAGSMREGEELLPPRPSAMEAAAR